jgi:hypothetical protein
LRLNFDSHPEFFIFWNFTVKDHQFFDALNLFDEDESGNYLSAEKEILQ